jgi:hypothetical protein
MTDSYTYTSSLQQYIVDFHFRENEFERPRSVPQNILNCNKLDSDVDREKENY